MATTTPERRRRGCSGRHAPSPRAGSLLWAALFVGPTMPRLDRAEISYLARARLRDAERTGTLAGSVEFTTTRRLLAEPSPGPRVLPSDAASAGPSEAFATRTITPPERLENLARSVALWPDAAPSLFAEISARGISGVRESTASPTLNSPLSIAGLAVPYAMLPRLTLTMTTPPGRFEAFFAVHAI